MTFDDYFTAAGPNVRGTKLLRSIEAAEGALDANALTWFLLSYFPDGGLIAVKRVIRAWFVTQDMDAVDAAMAALWTTRREGGSVTTSGCC